MPAGSLALGETAVGETPRLLQKLLGFGGGCSDSGRIAGG